MLGPAVAGLGVTVNPNDPNQQFAPSVGLGGAAAGMPPGAPSASPNFVVGGTGASVNGNSNTFGLQLGANQVGQFGQTYANSSPAAQQNVMAQQASQKFGLQNDVNYGDYQALSGNAQAQGAQAGQYLNTPGVSQALAQQNALAAGPSAYQQAGLGGLAQTAAGQGPNVAGMASGQAAAQAERAQLSAAASARGGAYAGAAAATQAGQNAANVQGQAAVGAAQTAAQQQLGAQSALAGAANQAQAGQVGAAQASLAGQAGQQTNALQYYEGQQGAAQTQAGLAAQLAQSQVANDYGLAGTQLQTSTQQNIANQQQQTQFFGAGLSALGAGVGTLSLLSTGGAYAAAKGARDAGAPEHVASHVGAIVGQSIGVARGGPSTAVWPQAQAADTGAAAVGARQPPEHQSGMSPEEARATLAQLRSKAKAPRAAMARPAPTPQTTPNLGTGEPLEHQAYQMGQGLARAYAGMGAH